MNGYTWRIDHEARVDLSKFDPGAHGGLEREEAVARTTELGAELADLTDLLFEASKHGLLIVLQGRDTSGKDGMIRCLLSHINAQSCRVVPFKVPTAEELAHDFLWRIHACTPARGSIAIFNRSHYEDVLVARVHELAGDREIEARYGQIRHFEDLLVYSGTIICKFMLHISPEEQRHRLLDREKDAEKAWKLAVGDWQERERWDDYTAAYERALGECGRETAAWHVVPANHKWFRDLAVVDTLVHALRPYRDGWLETLGALGHTRKAELAAYRAEHPGV